MFSFFFSLDLSFINFHLCIRPFVRYRLSSFITYAFSTLENCYNSTFYRVGNGVADEYGGYIKDLGNR